MQRIDHIQEVDVTRGVEPSLDVAGIPLEPWEYPSKPKLGINSQRHSVLPTESRFNGSRAEIGAYVGNSPGNARTLINALDLETWVYLQRINISDKDTGPAGLQFQFVELFGESNTGRTNSLPSRAGGDSQNTCCLVNTATVPLNKQ